MCVSPMPLQCAKGVFYYGLPAFVVMWILFDVIIVDVYRILVFAALYNTLGKFGALLF